MYITKTYYLCANVIIIKQLKNNDPTLDHIDLRALVIGSEGAIALTEAVKMQSVITNLEIWGNGIKKSHLEALDRLLEKNRDFLKQSSVSLKNLNSLHAQQITALQPW